VIGGRVLDASALVGFALIEPYPQALVWTAVEAGMVLAVPATALATAWARTPATAHDALQVLLDLPNTVVEALDTAMARSVGLRLGLRPEALRAGHVVACGSDRGWPIVSGDPASLRAIDPQIEVDPLP